MSLVIRNVAWWDWCTDRLQTGDLLVDEGPDGRVGLLTGPPPAGARILDGRGDLAIAGLVCGHHHLYSALARGMPAPPRAPRDFLEILQLVWWRVDSALDRDMILASALAGAMDMIRCGVTAVVDHHASPRAWSGSLDALAEGLDRLGLAHVLCLELSDRDGPEATAAALDETDRWLAAGRPGLVGLHASFTVGDRLLEDAVDLARRHGAGLHLHVAEDPLDQERCLAEHGGRVAARLQEAGVLDQPGTILAHGLHLDDAERALVRESGAWVAVNTESNQNNAVGEFRGDGLDPARLLLGTDGMHGDLLRSLQAAFLTGREHGGLQPGQAWQALWNNRRYLQAHHVPAARANDLVLLDYASPTPVTAENLLGHALFGLDARHVRTVICRRPPRAGGRPPDCHRRRRNPAVLPRTGTPPLGTPRRSRDGAPRRSTAMIPIIDRITDPASRANAVARYRERGIVLPTFAQMRDPSLIPEAVKARLRKIGLWDLDPLNLFRITWHNEPTERGGLHGPVNTLELPSSLTGVDARIVLMIGKWFPTGSHKVGAAYGCLAPAVISGGFDPTRHRAAWPSTGNYCRGGAFDSYLMDCHAIAILPEEMSRERFEWLETVGAEVIATPGCESNVKEIYDKCWELRRTRDDVVIFNQFDEFGNAAWHHAVTGPAVAEVFAATGAPNLAAFVSSTGSAGTIAAGDYLRAQRAAA